MTHACALECAFGLLAQSLDAVGFLEVVAEDAGLTALNLAVLCRSAAQTVVQFHGFYRCRTRLILYITHSHNSTSSKSFATHGRFSRIRQAAPMFTPSNTWFAAPNTPSIRRHLDQFSHLCTAHGRWSLYFTMGTGNKCGGKTVHRMAMNHQHHKGFTALFSGPPG